MKPSTLTGADLNRAVAMALIETLQQPERGLAIHRFGYGQPIPDYAGDIAAAWPLIKDRKIELRFIFTDALENGYWQAAHLPSNTYAYNHKTDPQVAAMRCFVASVYGDDINLEEA